MAFNSTAILTEKNTDSIIFDLFALIVITLVPPLSHMFSIPFYMIDPMRIMLVLAFVHTSKRNAYILAMLLPLFSFLISTNTVMIKMILIGSELSINVWLFYFLQKKLNNDFMSMLLSILLSKIYYYPMKLGLIATGLLNGIFFDTPFYLQAIVAFALSLYTFLILEKGNRVKTVKGS